jgi:hypothetical protein
LEAGVVALVRYCSEIYLEALRKAMTILRTGDVLAEFQTEHLPNISLARTISLKIHDSDVYKWS